MYGPSTCGVIDEVDFRTALLTLFLRPVVLPGFDEAPRSLIKCSLGSGRVSFLRPVSRTMRFDLANLSTMSLSRIPEAALRLLRNLAQGGQKGWIVGGAVRDALMGRASDPDWDIATTATPERVAQLFRKVVPTGIAHGTVTVLLGGYSFEVTTLRGESSYSDGRHPDEVRFIGSIEADLERRDFTVNAMAYDPLVDELIDPFGGADDLRRRVLRAVGNPARRFSEDGLRLLRAARFAATLEMSVEEQTEQAMATAAPTLDRVSAERKRDELRKLLGATAPSVGLALLDKTDLWRRLFQDHPRLCGELAPEIKTLLWQRIDNTKAHLPWRLSALLVDCPLATANASSAAVARSWLKLMRFDRDLTQQVSELVSGLAVQPVCVEDTLAVRRLAVRIGGPHLPGWLALHRAEAQACGAPETTLEALGVAMDGEIARGLPLTLLHLAVNGRDLETELGLRPGPSFGAILRSLHHAVVDGKVRNERGALLELAKVLGSQA